jgi:hypothetical protein
VPLQSIAGGKPAPAAPFQPSKDGSFHIEDPAFGDLSLWPEDGDTWFAQHVSWWGDSAGSIGQGRYTNRLEALRDVLAYGAQAVSWSMERDLRGRQ